MSSKSDLALSIRGLSKSYTIAHGALKRPTFREVCMDRLQHPFRKPQTETFWALNDISFDVKKGEVVGIIGRNGAGKSTLLKILSRITEPTSGEIDVYGRIGSLLEVGTGFHPELTGRENIYLNGAILGMRRAEIARQFDEIVNFAEVEKFLDTPVKRYSSGMYVRLAFAVAAHLRSEILIVDEVLAVGDTEFQKKCLGKMKDVSSDGRTVLFVSHNMAAVRSLCGRGVLLTRGNVDENGESEKAIAAYMRGGQAAEEAYAANGVSIELRVIDESGRDTVTWAPEGDLNVQVRVSSADPIRRPAVDIACYTDFGARLFSIQSDRLNNATRVEEHFSQTREWRFCLRNPGLACESVSLDIGVRERGPGTYLACWRGARTIYIDLPPHRRTSAAGAILVLPCEIQEGAQA